MRSLRYFLIINILLLVGVADGYACFGPYFQPSGYMMFRAYNPDGNINTTDAVQENCLAWQRLTSMTIPIEDIRYVVYTMPLKEYEAFYDGTGTYLHNFFTGWISQYGRDIMDFLLLAKTNEYIRQKRSSRWYYPTMRIDARMTIEEVVEKALSNTSTRLRDRYLLQAIRALFSLGNYEECIKLWNDEMSKFPQYNAMRKLAQPYIAGAEFRLGHSDTAFQYYAELGDSESIAYCAKQMGKELTTIDLIELVHRYAPNSSELERLVQNAVREVEIWNDNGGYNGYRDCTDLMKSQSSALYQLSLRVINEDKTSNPAMWYYTASFLADFQGNTQQATQLLSLAEKAKGTDYVKESIKVLRIYLDAKALPYDNAYEQRLFAQLQWLDNKIKSNITPEAQEKTIKNYYSYLSINKSYYYWNDMMRRVLLSVVCPRMIEQDKQVRALQLANMASNRLLGLVNKIETYSLTYQDKDACCISTGGGQMIEMPLNEFRRSTKHFNHLDYCNDFFILTDSIGVDNVIAYYGRVRSPKSDFDRFLNTRGYVDREYLLDIVGTQCLRNMRYADAERYLGAITPSFYGHLNVCQTQDPFEIRYTYGYDDTDFRYQFAKEMNALERKIASTANPDEKAQTMVLFAIGLRNSFGRSWSLTQYFNGVAHYGSKRFKDWQNGPEMQVAYKRVDELIATACNIVTDREVAAMIQYDLCNFREVATKYYDTQMAKVVWGKCDNLIDYHAEKQCG